MEINFDINGTLEVDVNPPKKIKRRRGDDFDYNDPMIEPIEGENEMVELEPHIENFFVYTGTMDDKPKKILAKYKKTKKQDKRQDRPTDLIFCLQNSLYDKILNGIENENDIFEFLMFDCILNSDSQFKKLKNVENTKIQDIISNGNLQELHDSYVVNNKSKEKLEEFFKNPEIYSDGSILISPELCEAMFNFLIFKIIVQAYQIVVVDKKKSNFNKIKKEAFENIHEMVSDDVKNKKQLGFYMYKHAKKCKMGRYNGFKPIYLSVEKEIVDQLTSSAVDDVDNLASKEEDKEID